MYSAYPAGSGILGGTDGGKLKGVFGEAEIPGAVLEICGFHLPPLLNFSITIRHGS